MYYPVMETTQIEIDKKRVYVYIDGFNLYYGALNHKGNGRKWLNLELWLSKLLKDYKIEKIKFFTARVSGKYDEDKPRRQDLYFRALRTIPCIEIIEGRFLNKKVKLRDQAGKTITGHIPEEKGTDVNLATHLVNDGHFKKFDIGVVVSNDSDLSEAVKIVTQELNLEVGIINPCIGSHFNKQLTEYASFKRQVRGGPIIDSQFPTELSDGAGSIFKPSSW